MKAFASEALTVMTVLGLFLDSLVKPTGKPKKHTESFDELRIMVDVLSTGDAAVERIPMLERVILEHSA